MPRGKSAARRGNHQTSSRGGRRGPNNQSSFEPSEGSTHRRGNHEEARNTERHHDFWNTDRKLRHAKVNFVSAGTLEPLEPKDTETAMAKMTLESPEPGDNETMTVLEEDHEEQLTINKPFVAEMLLDCETPVPKGIETISRIENNNVEQATFIIDPRGSSTRIQTGLPPPIIRSSSPTPSNSSEEVILFRGRDREGRAISRASSDQRVTRPKESIDRKIRVVEDRIHELQQVLHQPTISRPAVPAETSSEDDSRFLGKPKSRRIRQKELEKQSLKKAEEDAILADYLANISEEDVTPLETFGQRELGGDIDSWQKTGESSSDALKVNKILGQQERGGSLDPWQETGESSSDALKVNEILNSEWTHSDICDFDDLSTSDGLRGEVHAILSKRNRPSGIQYLIVWQNHDVDEARWVPSSTLRSEIALAQIAEFEREETFVPQYADNEDEDTSGSADINLGGDIIEVEEDVDDENVNKQQIKHMSDEQLARLLAKQEELGMGSAELLLFDNEADADEDEYESYSRSKFTPMMMPSKGKGKEPGSKRPRGDFPSAARLADAYDGFDVMDFDRPSLKKKPKGRKGKLVFDLSDSELEAAMQMSWENDRTKKKDKKLEREELRSQGLLGGKTGKTDMSSKYKDGMGIHAVKEEIKNFLMGDNTTLALPPMEKADRKVVHELANAFNLKSKSAGGGNKRFPILYRTQRTHIFTENAFNAVEARLSRKFLPRMDAKRSGVAVKRAGTGGSFNKAAVSYRDGDIVGGSAPELGAENKGRAMLEKMGWSSGTALGALNNKGILQPVSHVVKTTKAGLG